MTKKEALEKIKELEMFINECNGIENDTLFLLSVDEYKKYKSKIPPIRTWWWLRSPGNYTNYAAGVYSDGSVSECGHYVNSDYGAVRPALRFSNLKSKIYKSEKGDDYFIFNETRWKVIDKDSEIAISELPIGFEKFNEDNNDYETSHIRKWLMGWI